MAENYFDFHFHPLFKNYISLYEEKFPSKRQDDLAAEFKLNGQIANKLDDLVLHILQSQSSINQCIKGKVRIGVTAIASLEFGFADSKGFMSQILKSKFTAPMDKIYFDKVRGGEISYFLLMLKELELYRRMAGDPHNKLNILSRKNVSPELLKSDIDENNDAEFFAMEKINCAIGLEGAHSLCRYKIGQTIHKDLGPAAADIEMKDSLAKIFKSGYKDQDGSEKEVGTDPVKSLKGLFQGLWEMNFDILYITLTHLSHISEQFLATHAFGMKMLKHAAFYPVGNGLSELGKQVINACYRNEMGTINYPILIDIKHMGLKSRQDFYAYRKEQNHAKIPVVASHVGVTGYSISEWRNALNRDKCQVFNFEGVRTVEIEMERRRCGEWGSSLNNDFTFNPWSINLMDDDIQEILESDGLIGLSLDVRILGFQAKIGMSSSDQSEFITTADFQTHFPHVGLLNLPGASLESMVEAAESWLVPTKEERHPLCFCFNVVHIVSVGQMRTTKDPWKNICIGSDFDGLIEPLKICRDTASLNELEVSLKRWLPVASKAYAAENGGGNVLEKKTNVEVDQLIQGILYENGKRFIKQWLRNQ